MKAVLSFILATTSVSVSAQMPPAAPGPSMSDALALARIAVQQCGAKGYAVSASVLDSAGVLKVLVAADGAPAMAVTSSQRKAATVLAFGVPSAASEAKAATDKDFAAKIAADPALFARAGGQPIVAHGALIGAIGIGGAPGGEKDDACARSALAALPAAH